MIVRFTSSTSGELVMLPATARRMLEALDKECTARGVITEAQVAAALSALRAAIQAEHACGGDAAAQDDEDEDKEKQVSAGDTLSFARRAAPLVRLLEWTQREGGYVLWEAAAPF